MLQDVLKQISLNMSFLLSESELYIKKIQGVRNLIPSKESYHYSSCLHLLSWHLRRLLQKVVCTEPEILRGPVQRTGKIFS